MRAAIPLTLLLALAPSAGAGGAPAPPAYKIQRFEEAWASIRHDGTAFADPFDAVKNHPLGGDWHLTFGGSGRVRFEGDTNRTLGAGAVDDEELLRWRTFLHLELGWRKAFRWFAEVRASDTLGEDRPAPALMRDDPDFQNFFLEGTLASETAHPVTLRVGRQELLFGAQRLVSPLDWSNTRRTFDGVSVTASSKRTKTVVFGTHPVMHEINDIDSPDDDVLFAGVDTTFQPNAAHVVEGWWYLLSDARDTFAAEKDPLDVGDAERHSFGARWAFAKDGWHAETEWTLQDGDIAGDDISAYSGSLAGGFAWEKAPWKPKLTAGLDLATGDADPHDGTRGTFNHLFPSGHAWLGHVDLVGRQNVRAARLELETTPVKGLKWITTLHRFELDETRDALYNSNGGVVRRDATGAAGRDVSTELDMGVWYTFKRHHQVSAEVVRWWSGDFISETGSGRDATWYWLAYEFRF